MVVRAHFRAQALHVAHSLSKAEDASLVARILALSFLVLLLHLRHVLLHLRHALRRGAERLFVPLTFASHAIHLCPLLRERGIHLLSSVPLQLLVRLEQQNFLLARIGQRLLHVRRRRGHGDAWRSRDHSAWRPRAVHLRGSQPRLPLAVLACKLRLERLEELRAFARLHLEDSRALRQLQLLLLKLRRPVLENVLLRLELLHLLVERHHRLGQLQALTLALVVFALHLRVAALDGEHLLLQPVVILFEQVRPCLEARVLGATLASLVLRELRSEYALLLLRASQAVL